VCKESSALLFTNAVYSQSFKLQHIWLLKKRSTARFFNRGTRRKRKKERFKTRQSCTIVHLSVNS